MCGCTAELDSTGLAAEVDASEWDKSCRKVDGGNTWWTETRIVMGDASAAGGDATPSGW